MIAGCKPPLVIGLYGTWGHGKTSLMRQVEASLAGRGDQECIPVWFDAWQHQFDEEPALALLHTMVDVTTDRLGRRAGKRLRHKLRIIGTAVGGIVLTKATSVPMGDLGAVGERVDRERFLLRERQVRLREHFRELISDATEGGRHKLVFFIDDLDRCSPEQVLRVLEALKVFLNMESCVYVIAVDRDALEHSVAVRYDGAEVSEMAYLDKIIQLPFQIPPIARDAMNDFVAELMPDELAHLAPDVVEVLGANPRRAKLFVNTFMLASELAEKVAEQECEPSHLLCILLIQYELPGVYKRAIHDPDLLRRPDDWSVDPDQQPPRWAEIVARRLADVPDETILQLIQLSGTRDLSLEPVTILVQGRNTQGDEVYTYLRVPLARVEEIKQVLASGQSFVPSEHGTVIAAGRGKPTDDVKAEVGSTHYMVYFEPSASGQANGGSA